MPDEIVGGAAVVASADPIRDAVASSVADAGMIDDVASVSETVETPPAADVVTPDAPAAVVSEPVAETPKPETKPKTEDEEIAEIEAKLVAENPSMTRGQISRSRHQAMLTRRANEHTKALEAEKAKYSHYETPETQERLQGALLFEQHPQKAWDAILSQEPRYRAIIDAHVEKVIKERGLAPAATTQQNTPPASTEEYPTPDALLPDGSLGYSAEALTKIRELDRKALQSDFDKKLDERFKAIDGDLAPAREVKAVKEQIAKSHENMSVLLNEARTTWPGFTERQDKIKELIFAKGNERMTLRQAYDKVRESELIEARTAAKPNPQLEAEMRARIIKEMNENAAGPGRTFKPGVPAVLTPGESERADPIRDAVAKAASTLR